MLYDPSPTHSIYELLTKLNELLNRHQKMPKEKSVPSDDLDISTGISKVYSEMLNLEPIIVRALSKQGRTHQTTLMAYKPTSPEAADILSRYLLAKEEADKLMIEMMS